MSTTPAEAPKTLHRNLNNRVVAGICSGLADYFAIDPILVRLAFVAFAFAGGASLLVYIVLWIVMLPAQGPMLAGSMNAGSQAGIWVGMFFVVLGGLFLIGNTGLFSWWNWSFFWPLILVALGLLILSRRLGGH
jgi:phage shock protein PspC (stress-responsive transcriptional regulator)